MKELAEAYTTSNPSSDIGPYYQAWADYLSGDVEGAQARLKSLLAHDPDDGRAKFTLQALANPTSVPGPAFQDLSAFAGVE